MKKKKTEREREKKGDVKEKKIERVSRRCEREKIKRAIKEGM
jgi:hypothetical protein